MKLFLTGGLGYAKFPKLVLLWSSSVDSPHVLTLEEKIYEDTREKFCVCKYKDSTFCIVFTIIQNI